MQEIQTKETILEKLKYYNNPEFKFNEAEHKYTLSGEHFISVTQFISRFHKHMDTEYWANKKAEERGITKEEILKEWQDKNDRANVIGTALHLYCENYFNKIYQELPTDLDVINRINKFNVIYATHLYKLTPIVLEQRVFSKRFKIAGMLDSLFIFNGKLVNVDWKTNKQLLTDDDFKGSYEKMLYPFEHLYKNHFNEYSIQLSLYKLILREIGLHVDVGYLVYIGPEHEAKIYKTLDLSDILEKYLLETTI